MSNNILYTLGELAQLLQLKVSGDSDCKIRGIATLKSAQSGDISFLSNNAYIKQLANCKASAVIVEDKFADSFAGNKLLSANPYLSFAQATHLFDNRPKSSSNIHPSACISDSAQIAKGVSIAANAVIEANVIIGEGSIIGAGCYIGANSRLGSECELYANVTLYHDVHLADHVIVHSNTVIGSDGFGFAFDGEKSLKIIQLGGVRIASHVEVGAGTTIDRGAIEHTVIGVGVKIDNQVQIGHNCIIGEHSIICGCTGLAGSVTIGKYCIIGGGAGAVGHITIADKVKVSAMSLVGKSITEAGMYSSGTGHMKTSDWKRNIVRFRQLDDMAKRLKELEKLGRKIGK